MHCQIVGITTSGKSTLAKRLAIKYRQRGFHVLVLDPLLDRGWLDAGADLLTDNQTRFLKTAEKSRGCMLFIDESGEMIGRYNAEMFWLATRARHFGHVSHFISQRYIDIAKTVRDQCTKVFCFRVSSLDAKNLSIDWGDDNLLQASTLNKFEFIYKSRFGPAQRQILTADGSKPVSNHATLDNFRTDSSRVFPTN